jgi:UDP-N-acetylmuramyl pentapeptide phosphotransferase/UDP-N-acetylglucosamine-1-phosphate transferase
MTFYIVLSLSAFMVSLLGTRLTILALRARPRPVSPSDLLNKAPRPVPTGGGVAVVMGMIICLMVADIDYGVILSLFLLAALSLMDDIIGINLPVKLLVQVLAVLIPLGVMDVSLLFADAFPTWVDKAVIAVLWVWFINLFNFMDGIDGISATEMICISGGFCGITIVTSTFPTPLFTYSLIVLASAWGFIWWNWYPAKIRLGEVGSVPIGFLLGYLLLLAITSGYVYAAAILPAYYLADATITLVYRARKGKRLMVRHSEYYYQLAVLKGRRHDTVTRYIFGVNLLLILLAVFSVLNPELALFHLGLAYMAVFMILGFFAYTAPNPQHEPF